MGDAWFFGPVMIKEQWVMFFIAGLAAYIVIRIGLARKWIEPFVLDSLWNALFLFGVVWKLSYILLHPLTVWDRPLSLLYFTGGDVGVVFGLGAVMIYFLIRSHKENISSQTYIESGFISILVAYGSYQFLMLVLSFSPSLYPLFQMLLSGILFVYWFVNISHERKQVLWPSMILWFSLGELLLSYMKSHVSIWLGFSFSQLVFIALSLAMILLSYRMKANFNKT